MPKSIPRNFTDAFSLQQRLKEIAGLNTFRFLLPITVFLIAFGMQRSVALLGLDLHHDALMFDAAKQLLDGELPFRDFFFQYNLGTVVFHMLALKAFGTYVASLKIATSLVYALIAVFIYTCAALLGKPWQGFGMALVWSTLSPFHMPMLNGYHPWSTVYMMACIMAGAWFLLMAAQKRTGLHSGFAGICFNLAFWFKQIAGIQILLVILWILLNTRRTVVGEKTAHTYRSMMSGFVLGGIISALPFFGYLYWNELFNDWWRSSFVFNKYFALNGISGSGLKEFVHNMLPVQRDFGYKTYIWMLLPLYVVIMAFGGKNKGDPLPLRNDEWSRTASLFMLLGFAGWLEYFPLSHSFHTQLFLAPVFCLIALGQPSAPEENTGLNWRRLVTPFLIVLALAFAYETFEHLKGLREKIRQTRVTLEDEMPAKGLRLLPEYVASFERFSKKAETLITPGQESLPAIPLSVDPLRAIFPALGTRQTVFKMGVDWSWPNELVEPGFNQRIAELIRERHSPIYGDSIIAIPGYIPVSLLEMPSPLGEFHSLYLPSADVSVSAPAVNQVGNIYILQSAVGKQPEADLFNSVHIVCEAPTLDEEYLVPYGKLSASMLNNIDQLHITILSDCVLPQPLTEMQYEKFLFPAMAAYSNKIGADNYYSKKSVGIFQYGIKTSLNESDWAYLAKFYLSRGKLYAPRFASTLAQAEKNRPLFMEKTLDNGCPRVVWSKSQRGTSAAFADKEIYLAIPRGRLIPKGQLVDGGPMTMHVQVVMKDKTTYNKYLHYQYRNELQK